VTWRSCMPAVTARARSEPPVPRCDTDRAPTRTTRSAAGFGPVRARTPSAPWSSAPRDRIGRPGTARPIKARTTTSLGSMPGLIVGHCRRSASTLSDDRGRPLAPLRTAARAVWGHGRRARRWCGGGSDGRQRAWGSGQSQATNLPGWQAATGGAADDAARLLGNQRASTQGGRQDAWPCGDTPAREGGRPRFRPLTAGWWRR
jgi:hypothetical protein